MNLSKKILQSYTICAERVDPALVYHNDKGPVESVRYELVNAMLLNEFLKEHRKVQDRERRIQE